MRGEVYPGIYQLDDAGAHRTFPAETVVKADACVEAWAARDDAAELTLTGNGLVKYRAALRGRRLPARAGGAGGGVVPHRRGPGARRR